MLWITNYFTVSLKIKDKRDFILFLDVHWILKYKMIFFNNFAKAINYLSSKFA